MTSLPPRDDDALAEEIRHHLAESEDLLVEQGWDRAAARAEAARRFGDRERVHDELRTVWRSGALLDKVTRWVRGFRADIAYAIRGILGNPGFALPVMATLALGIGATGSIFAVADPLLLRPLPYDDPERWVVLSRVRTDGAVVPEESADRVRVWQDAASDLFDGWVGFGSTTLVRTDLRPVEALSVLAVTPGVEQLLGIPVLMGRGFTAEDALPGAPPVAVMAREHWERTGADPGIVGRTIRLENGPVTVVGVLQGGMRFPTYGGDRDLWVPLRSDFTWMDEAADGVQELWGRLGAGLSVQAGQDRIDALAASLAERSPSERSWEVRLVPLSEHRRGNVDTERAMWMLVATGVSILVIALLNGVSLTLVRAGARAREMAVRVAIGGSKGAILRQLLAEGILLGLLSGVASTGLAAVALHGMRDMLPTEVTFFSAHAIAVEGRTLLVVFALALLAGGALGLVPGAQTLKRQGPATALGGRQPDDTPGRRRARNVVVGTQVALSMTLLAAAGLLSKSLIRLLTVDPGFQHERLALASLFPSPARYPDAASQAELLALLEERLERQPGIEAVTISTGASFAFGVELRAEGTEGARVEQPDLIPYTAVTEDYLTTMGVRLVSGRDLVEADADAGNVLVDRDLAGHLWGSASPLGRRFRLGPDREWLTVVGVVEELRLLGRDQRAGPYQFLMARRRDGGGRHAEVGMRTSGDPRTLLPMFRRTLASIDPEQWTWKLRTGSTALAEEEDRPRFLVTLVGLLASIAVTLTALGLYGVLAYSVGRRTRELGIRVALGADRSRLRTSVLGEGMSMTGVGIVAGMAGALAASRVVEEFLYELDGRDPSTLVATATLLLLVALVASYLPARHATAVDPARVLAAE